MNGPSGLRFLRDLNMANVQYQAQIGAPIPYGTVNLGKPKSTTIITPKRDGIIAIGDVDTEFEWDVPTKVPITITPKEKKDINLEIGDVDTEFEWDVPNDAPIEISARARRGSPVVDGLPGGTIGLGKPTSTFVITPKRANKIEFGPVDTEFGWDTPISVPIEITPKDKRDPQLELGDSDGEFEWDTTPDVPVEISKEKRVPAPQISATITWETQAPTSTAAPSITPLPTLTPPDPVGCACADDAAPGRYCGYCSAIEGSWVSWNAYKCDAEGACTDLGFSRKCVDGSTKQCPSIYFD